jgi:hypothetical protein
MARRTAESLSGGPTVACVSWDRSGPGKSSINTNGNSTTHLLAAAWLCVLSVRPAAAQNFLEGVVSLNVTVTKEETCIARHTA